MTALPKAKIPEQEYLAGERDGWVRHEYIDGEVYAMAGASDRHGLIVSALVYALKPHARKQACQLFSSDMKLRLTVANKTLFYYPDILLTCNPADDDSYYRTAPRLIVEVLSESTERTDRREKLLAYIRIDSLIEYVIIEQALRSVEIYRRKNDWLPDVIDVVGDVRLDSLDCTLTLDDIYADLALLGV